ncbi:MAG: hypothetical protein ACLFV4_03460 [Candidatus Hydrogenedentota bacterium]
MVEHIQTLKHNTYRLFAIGMAQVASPASEWFAELGGFDADRQALSGDWEAVGNGLWAAIEEEKTSRD